MSVAKKPQCNPDSGDDSKRVKVVKHPGRSDGKFDQPNAMFYRGPAIPEPVHDAKIGSPCRTCLEGIISSANCGKLKKCPKNIFTS